MALTTGGPVIGREQALIALELIVPVRPGYRRDLFIYTDSKSIGAGVVDSITFQFDGSAEYELFSIQWDTDVASPAPPVALVKIIDSGRSTSLMNNARAPIRSLAGDGQQPYKLPAPYTFAPNSVLEFEIENAHSATQTIYLTISGWKWIRA